MTPADDILHEQIAVRIPFADDVVEVAGASIGARPVFGQSGARRVSAGGDETWRRPASAPIRPWPARGIGAAAARDRVHALVDGARTGEGPIEGYRLWEGRYEPVYRVEAVVPGPATWAFYVGAGDGRVRGVERTSREATGRVYGNNPFTSGVERVGLPGITGATLSGPRVRAQSCDVYELGASLFTLASCTRFGQHAVADAAGDFEYPPTAASYVDPFAEVHLYYHADRFVTWLDDRYGLRFRYGPMNANANFPTANAFFGDFDLDGVPEVSFGTDEATGTDFAYDADVVYHELGHAVVGEWAPDLPFLGGDAFGLEWAGGAANEGLADVFSMIHSPDPLTAEYAGSAFGMEAIRDLERPRHCPEDLRGEVHADGEILASFGWQLVSDAEVGPDLTAELLAGAIPRLDADVTWDRIGRAFHRAADEMHAGGVAGDRAHTAILEHLAASGMETCGRVIPLDGGAEAELLIVNGGLFGDLERLPAGVAMSVEVPEGAVAARVEVRDFQAVDGMGYAVYGRWGEAVAHDFTVVEALGLGFATPATWDFVVDGAGERLTVALGPDEALALRPGETLYLSVASRNLGGLVPFDFQYGSLVVSAEADVPPEAPPRPEGCDHGSGAGGASGVSLLLLLALRRR